MKNNDDFFGTMFDFDGDGHTDNYRDVYGLSHDE